MRAMDKIYQRRGIEVESSISGGIRFRGEQQDMEEMAGNLIDNACKWASSQVTVTVQVLNEGGSARVHVRTGGRG